MLVFNLTLGRCLAFCFKVHKKFLNHHNKNESLFCSNLSHLLQTIMFLELNEHYCFAFPSVLSLFAINFLYITVWSFVTCTFLVLCVVDTFLLKFFYFLSFGLEKKKYSCIFSPNLYRKNYCLYTAKSFSIYL